MSIIFKQTRIGHMGKPFIIYKLRTMDENKNVNKWQNFLRITHIDELPQILNILKGDMVLVGPRPLIPEEQRWFSKIRLSVKPGLTGWWQIHGCDLDRIEEYDREYILLKSFWFDLKIILLTPITILKGGNIG